MERITASIRSRTKSELSNQSLGWIDPIYDADDHKVLVTANWKEADVRR